MTKTDDLKLHQQRSFKALEIVDAICRQNGVNYFLLAGTVLGAVRHKGFIPWDDDIDIGMFMEDYQKFGALCKDTLPRGYFWSSPDTNYLHPRLFGKILFEGQHCLDVFPIVKTTDSNFFKKIQWMQVMTLYVAYQIKIKEPLALKPMRIKRLALLGLGGLLSALTGRKWILRQAFRAMNRYEKATSASYINICSKYPMNTETIKSEWALNLAPLEFETGMFPAFSNTGAYLTHLYGDYMKLPPEEKRFPDHQNQAIKIQRVKA